MPLRPGREEPPEEAPSVELLITDAGAWNGDAPPELADGLPAGSAARHAEARLVAQRIAALVREEGVPAGEIVLLLRAATDMTVFERALELEGLATLATGAGGWWARRQVQDLCCYLGALANPRDENALLGLVASPLVGLSSDALALTAMHARRTRAALWDALDDPALAVPLADRERLAAFRRWFAAEREHAPRAGLDDLLRRVVGRTGYDLHVLALPGGARRLANVHKLMRLAAAFETARGRDVRGFIDLATAELEAEAREPDAPVDLGDLDAVRLMTIHAAKGLEFGVVVVADLGRLGNNRQPDLLVDGDAVGLRLVSMDGAREKALDFEAIAERRRAADEAEDRRVMHVAVTRAEERLILSGAVKLGDDWPAPRPGAPPLSWMGPALVPHVARLTADVPVIDHERVEDGRTARVRVRLNAPATVGRVLRLGPGAPGEQLAFALGEASEVPAGAPAPAPGARSPAGGPALGAPEGERRPPPPATLSYTALARYAACPYRFHLERGLGLPAQEPPAHLVDEAAAAALDPLVRGSLVHALLERLDGTAAPAEDEVRALAEATEVELGDDDVADLLGMVGAFARSDLNARLAGAAEVRREHGFAFPLGDDGPLVNGVVDVLAREADGTALVVDYKSDRVADADLAALVDASYGGQRQIYALACLRAGAPAVEVVHLFLERASEPVVRRYEAADAAALRGRTARPRGRVCWRGSSPSPASRTALCVPRARVAPASARTRRSARIGPWKRRSEAEPRAAQKRVWVPRMVRASLLPFHREPEGKRIGASNREGPRSTETGPGNNLPVEARRKERL